MVRPGFHVKRLVGFYLISRMMKFHFGFAFFIAAESSDSVGGLLLTETVLVVVVVGVLPVAENLIFTLTNGISTSPICAKNRLTDEF